MEISKSSDFKQVYAIGAIGGHSPYDFRIAFYNDSPKTLVEDGKSMTVMERKIDTEIILSPLAAKELANWLVEHIKDYEKVFGEIKRPGSVSTGSCCCRRRAASRQRSRDTCEAAMNNKEKVLLNRGIDKVRQKKFEEALEIFERLLAMNQEIPEVWNNRGVALYGLGSFEEPCKAMIDAWPSIPKIWML